MDTLEQKVAALEQKNLELHFSSNLSKNGGYKNAVKSGKT